MKADVNWREKCETMKKALDELKNLRHDSVTIDTEYLSQKIEEHKKIHEISVSELKNQNENMIEEMTRASEMNKKIQLLQKNITKLEVELEKRDPLFTVVLKYPKISLAEGERGSYVFKCGDDDEFQFRVTEEEEGSVIYKPLSIIPNNWKATDWMDKTARFKRPGIQALFSSISNAIV